MIINLIFICKPEITNQRMRAARDVDLQKNPNLFFGI